VKKILIDKEPWQTRVAILSDDNRLQDVYFQSTNKKELERCFFKGKISKVLPGIQTTFVDIGQNKAGFLHITEIDRTLATEKSSAFVEIEDIDEINNIKKPESRNPVNINKIFKENDEALVQVIKEPIHNKGAKLTTCFTLPGKFLVLMPNISQIGISRKIENKEERARLRNATGKNLPEGMGAIIRTTAENRLEKDIKKDLSFLIGTWTSIQKKYKKAVVGNMLHEDLPISFRVVRDHLDDDVDMVIINDKQERDSIHKFVKSFTPEHINKIRLYTEKEDLFDHFNIDKQIEKALQKKVLLKSGGSVIIETTEGMTSVDVNTGKFTGSSSNMEETILKNNLEAAEEIVTQLRLRNIGGLIVIDFVDMASFNHRQKLSRSLEKTLKERDKYQSVTLKVSEFGIVQMTRKRTGKTLVQQLMNVCPMCQGDSFVKSISTISFDIFKQFKKDIKEKNISVPIIFSVSVKVFDYLIHNEYKSILQLEKQYKHKIILECCEKLDIIQYKINPVS
jgi:ribonuclease G